VVDHAAQRLITPPLWRGSGGTVSAFAMSSLPRPGRWSTILRIGLRKGWVMDGTVSAYSTNTPVLRTSGLIPTRTPNGQTVMNLSYQPEFPPPDFVAFLAQRTGLSQEAAEVRLERWLGEYHASASQREQPTRSAAGASLSR